MTAETSAAAPAAPTDPATLLARGTAAAWAEGSAGVITNDFWLPDHARLDDRTRSAMVERLRALVSSTTAAIAARARTALAADPASPAIWADDAGAMVLDRLQDAGVLDDDALMADLCAQVRGELLGDALVATRPPGAAPLLVPRLARCDDPPIAAAAAAYLLAESARGSAHHADGIGGEAWRRLAWGCAAVLRERAAGVTMPSPVDAALADATRAILDDDDRGETLASSAVRLAAAIDARGAELPDLLVAALEEGRVALFVALLARARGIGLAAARSLVLDIDGIGLWLALRAQDLGRDTIARIAVALAHAEPRRDLEAFADVLDTIAALPPERAGDSMAPLALDPEFRAAVRLIGRTVR